MSYLLISPDFPPPLVGGSLVYVYTLLQHSSLKIDVLTSRLPQGVEELSRFNHQIFRNPMLVNSHSPGNYKLGIMYLYLILWAVWYSLFSKKHQALLLNISVIGNSLLTMIFEFFGVRTVILGYAEELTTALKGRSRKSQLKRALMKLAYKKATGLVVVCDFAKNILINLGVNPGKISIIPPSISPEKLLPTESIPVQPGLVLSVGRFLARKGFVQLMDAMKLVQQKHPQAKLVIAGGGPDELLLQNKIRNENLGGFVEIKTGLSDQNLSQYFGACQIFVLANLMLENGDCEGCPTVLIEASARSKPVIGGIEGGTSTAIDEGVTGYLIDPRDSTALALAIQMLLEQPELCQKIGRAGLQKVTVSHMPKITAKLFDVFLSEIVKVSRA